jgi:hypothetical protein
LNFIDRKNVHEKQMETHERCEGEMLWLVGMVNYNGGAV